MASSPADPEPTSETPEGPRPALRDLQVTHTSRDGHDGIALSDPLGIAEGQVFVPNGLLPIIARFDGTQTIAEIESELITASGEKMPSDLVSGLPNASGQTLLSTLGA